AGPRTLPVPSGVASDVDPAASQTTKSVARICISSSCSDSGFNRRYWLERGVELSSICVAHRDRDGTRSDRPSRYAESARPAPYLPRRAQFETGYSTRCGSFIGCFVVVRIREVEGWK